MKFIFLVFALTLAFFIKSHAQEIIASSNKINFSDVSRLTTVANEKGNTLLYYFTNDRSYISLFDEFNRKKIDTSFSIYNLKPQIIGINKFEDSFKIYFKLHLEDNRSINLFDVSITDNTVRLIREKFISENKKDKEILTYVNGNSLNVLAFNKKQNILKLFSTVFFDKIEEEKIPVNKEILDSELAEVVNTGFLSSGQEFLYESFANIESNFLGSFDNKACQIDNRLIFLINECDIPNNGVSDDNALKVVSIDFDSKTIQDTILWKHDADQIGESISSTIVDDKLFSFYISSDSLVLTIHNINGLELLNSFSVLPGDTIDIVAGKINLQRSASIFGADKLGKKKQLEDYNKIFYKLNNGESAISGILFHNENYYLRLGNYVEITNPGGGFSPGGFGPNSGYRAREVILHIVLDKDNLTVNEDQGIPSAIRFISDLRENGKIGSSSFYPCRDGWVVAYVDKSEKRIKMVFVEEKNI